MIETKEELYTKLSEEGYTSFEFEHFYKGQLKYSNSRYSFFFTPEYRDELTPVETLRELVEMDELQVYDKHLGDIIYDSY